MNLAKLVALVALGALGTAYDAHAQAKETKPVKQILVVISSKNAMPLKDGKSYRTGYYFNELTVPVKKLVDAGYQVVFANPEGNVPTMDVHSDSPSFFENDKTTYESFKKFHDGLAGLKKPKKLADVVAAGLDGYAAVLFPGGHAPMIDLNRDKDVARVLAHFHENGKPTAMICHGPISLLATLKDPNAFLAALEEGDAKGAAKLAEGWPYAGYKMTIFSTPEEQIAEEGQLKGKVRFYPDAALAAAGAKVEVAKPWSSQVVRDRELITGQNPNSDAQLAEALVKALQ